MQLLSKTINAPSVEDHAREILDSTPPLMWFIRRNMRSHRGGLSLAQFRALCRVNRHPNASVSMVAEHLGASLPTASRIVTGLVDKGFLTRHGCRWDRRQISLELTARGRDILQTARKATQQKMGVELSKLNSDDIGTIVRAMKILRETFGPVAAPGTEPAPQPIVEVDGHPDTKARKGHRVSNGAPISAVAAH